MSRKSTAGLISVFIIVTVCLLFANFLVITRKQDHSSNTCLACVQTHENRDDKKLNEQPISCKRKEKICFQTEFRAKEIVEETTFETKPREFRGLSAKS